jgi:pyridoxine 4-dehydrogenase
MTSSTGAEFTLTHLLGGQYRVPRLGYGAMQLAGPGVIGPPEDVPGAIEVLRRAADLGVRFFDTANAYGPRTVNQLIGRALSPFADDIVIGNKVGASRDPAGGWVIDSRPETVRTQVEEALLDLRADFSSLTYLRLWGDSQAPGNAPPPQVPLEEALGALVELRDEGKVRHIGLSGASSDMLQRALQLTPIAAVQNRFNLIDRSGIEVLTACESHGIAFVPFFPLAVGYLGELKALDAITRPARRLGVSGSAVALAWLLRRSPVMVPIPGTKSLAHLTGNVRAADVAGALTEAEVRALTGVEDEESATLSTMPAPMADALARRRRGSDPSLGLGQVGLDVVGAEKPGQARARVLVGKVPVELGLAGTGGGPSCASSPVTRPGRRSRSSG